MAINYRVCPDCKSKKVINIVYGYPSPELAADAEKGKIKLGGCVIMPENPLYFCKECDNKWNRQDAIDAAYNEIICISASVGGYFEGYYDVMIDFNDKKLLWKYSPVGDSIEKKLSDLDIMTFIDGLKVADILNWRRKYEEPDILDGTQWEVEIFRDRRNLKRSGSNKFPAEWEYFCELIRNISDAGFE